MTCGGFSEDTSKCSVENSLNGLSDGDDDPGLVSSYADGRTVCRVDGRRALPALWNRARGCTGDVCLMVCAQRDVHMTAALFVIADDSASDVHYDMKYTVQNIATSVFF